jgi:hypothetical protein
MVKTALNKKLSNYNAKNIFVLFICLIFVLTLSSTIVSLAGMSPVSVWIPNATQWAVATYILDTLDTLGIPSGPIAQYFLALSLSTSFFASPLQWLLLLLNGQSNTKFFEYFLWALALGV